MELEITSRRVFFRKMKMLHYWTLKLLHWMVSNEWKEKGHEWGIEEYLAKGYIRKLCTTNAAKDDPKTWHRSHFGVVNPNTRQVQTGVQAAAKSNGISPNDQLLQGPDLLQNLISILWKFGQKKIAFCSAIREMFHQVLIRDQDCPAQDFFGYYVWGKICTFNGSVCREQWRRHYREFPEAARATKFNSCQEKRNFSFLHEVANRREAWDRQFDKSKIIGIMKISTKRVILRVVMSSFDPLVFLSSWWWN